MQHWYNTGEFSYVTVDKQVCLGWVSWENDLISTDPLSGNSVQPMAIDQLNLFVTWKFQCYHLIVAIYALPGIFVFMIVLALEFCIICLSWCDWALNFRKYASELFILLPLLKLLCISYAEVLYKYIELLWYHIVSTYMWFSCIRWDASATNVSGILFYDLLPLFPRMLGE